MLFIFQDKYWDYTQSICIYHSCYAPKISKLGFFIQCSNYLFGPFILKKVNIKIRPTITFQCLMQLGLMPYSLMLLVQTIKEKCIHTMIWIPSVIALLLFTFNISQHLGLCHMLLLTAGRMTVASMK